MSLFTRGFRTTLDFSATTVLFGAGGSEGVGVREVVERVTLVGALSCAVLVVVVLRVAIVNL